MVGGRPREYDRDALAILFAKYIADTEIPIAAEFAANQGFGKQILYNFADAEPRFYDLLTRCVSKKEAALERQALAGAVNCSMAIFSLKQLGWTDRNESTLKGDKAHPLVVSQADANL